MEKKVQIFVFMLNYRSFVLLVFIVTEASLVSHDEYGDVHFIFAGMYVGETTFVSVAKKLFTQHTFVPKSDEAI